MTRLRYLVAATALLLMTMPAHASTITPGEIVSPDVFGVPTSPDILATTNGSFSLAVTGGTVTGTYTDFVAVDPFNVTCPTCLDFGMEITVNSAPAGASITQVFNGGLLVGGVPAAVDVGYVDDGNIAPSSVGYGPAGEDMNFNFTSLLTPGDTSAVLVIATDATSYQEVTESATQAANTGGILQLSGINAAGLKTVDVGMAGDFLAPAGPLVTTPEPSSLLLLGTGLLSLLGIALRRKRMA